MVNFKYKWESSACTYEYGITGYLFAASTRVDNTTIPASTYVDLSGAAYDTMGECTKDGFKWVENWLPKDGTASVATTPNTSTIATFTNTHDWDNKEGCLHCHSTFVQEVDKAMWWKDSYVMTGHRNAGAAIGAPWGLDNIYCSVCHASASPAQLDPIQAKNTSGHQSKTSKAGTTNLCFYCHNNSADVNNPAGVIAIASGEFVNNPTNGLAPLGNQFLNSPHAKFSGTVGQVKTDANYLSTFKGKKCGDLTTFYESGTAQTIPLNDLATNTRCTNTGILGGAKGTWAYESKGTCITCHDENWSLDDTDPQAKPIKRECTMCHATTGASGTQIGVASKHPTGAGTPLANLSTDPNESCEICHMPKLTAAGSPMHLFRISTDSSYSTAGVSQANIDGSGNAWVDLDASCGQCHGGSAGTFATRNGAPYMTKSYLSVVAKNMHLNSTNTAPTANYTKLITGLTVTLTDTSTDSGVAFPAMTSSYTPVFVKWGDGSSDKINAGTPISHPYATAGKFMIKYTVQDAGGLFGYKNEEVTVSPSETITVTLSSGLTDNAKIVLKKKGPYGWVTKKVNLSNSGTIFSIKKLGDYRIKVYKQGYTFDCNTSGNPIDITMGASASVTCTHTP